MIPIHLTISGIYSYQKAQEIDFTRLHQARLFGIFGSVGSGKSAILEAMTFALYDKSERLRGHDSRNYNLMNLKSDELLVRFQFQAFRSQPGIYLFEVSGKRSSKTFENVRTFTRRQFRKSADEWVPVDISAEELLGLSHENFRRTIIIPQGKFQEFLQLASRERNQMMKELFGLERFDLAAKTSSVQNRNTEEIRLQEGRLSEVETASKAALDELVLQLQALQSGREKISQQVEQLSQDVQQSQKLADLVQRLDEARQEEEQLSKKKAEMDDRQQRLQQYQQVSDKFRAPLVRRHDLQKQVEDISRQRDTLDTEVAITTDKLTETGEQLIAITGQLKKQESIEGQLKDIEKLQSIVDLQNSLADLEDQHRERMPQQEIFERQLRDLHASRVKLEKRLDDQKNQQLSTSQLTAVSLWFQQQESLEAEEKKLTREKADLQNRIQDLTAERSEWLAETGDAEWLTPLERSLPAADLLLRIKQAVAELQRQLEDRHDQQIQEGIEHQLDQMATHLTDGDPCPVCGAVHHPAPRKRSKTRKKARPESEVETIRENIAALTQLSNRIAEQSGKSEALEQQLLSVTENIDQLMQQQINHGKTKPFSESEMDERDDIADWLKQAEQRIRQREEWIAERDSLLKSEEELRRQLGQLKIETDQKTAEMNSLKARIETLGEQLTFYDIKQQHLWPSDPDAEKKQLREKMEAVVSAHQELILVRDKLQQDLDRLTGSAEALKQQMLTTKNSMEKNQAEIAEALQSSTLDTVEDAQQILDQALQVSDEQEVISQWRESLNIAIRNRENLTGQIGEMTFDQQHHQQLLDKLQQAKEELAETNRQTGALENQTERMRADLKTRKAVEKQLRQLRERDDKLKTLLKMFRGSKFVNFVSGIFLRELCQLANQRFQMLTRRQLALEVTDQNMFQVRDFLNDGRVRSINTLSGGQTFQASLCLALALADHVHQIAESEQNFFFLDEGFGTLDEDALRNVFEALKTLQSENRTVGVISHVEALQQEIDTSLLVTNDGESGSRIICSWEAPDAR